MASNLPYTLQDIQDRVEVLLNNDNDTPATTDDEWAVRLALINQAIGNWEGMDVFWDELWTSYTHGSTIAAGTTTYALTMTDLRMIGGFVRLVLNGATTYLQVISPEEYQNNQGEARVVYVTGNASVGWTLNLGWTPATGDGTVGATIKLDYYKFATRFTSSSNTTDKPEMSDPNFIVWYVSAQKSLMESKNNQFSVYSTEAANAMDRMKIMNDLHPTNNGNVIDDVDNVYGAIIGE